MTGIIKKVLKVILVVIAIFLIIGTIGAIFSDEDPATTDKPKAVEQVSEESPEESEQESRLASIENTVDEDGHCTYERKDGSDSAYLSGKSAYAATATHFVNTSKSLFDRETCNSFSYNMYPWVSDSRGNEHNNTLFLGFRITEEQFGEYNWDNLVGQSIGQALRDDGILVVARPLSGATYDDLVLNSYDG